MKAIVATPEGARLHDVPQPAPGPAEVLVQVKAASLNRADLAAVAARDGKVVGMEWAGEVMAAGADVVGFKAGDRVMCTGAGGFAQFAVTDWGRVMKIPDELAFEDATILMLALQTMHDALVTNGRMMVGDAVLIHGASSGVGLMGLQIAKLLGADLVVGTATNAARRARLQEHGADLAVDAAQPDWADAVLARTGGKGVDVIVDQVSGSRFNETMRAAAIMGRIVNVGRLGGGSGEFDFQLHALRRLVYTGVTFRTRGAAEIRELTARMSTDLAPAIAARTLRLPVDSVFPLQDAAAALERMRANQHFGKIVLTV